MIVDLELGAIIVLLGLVLKAVMAMKPLHTTVVNYPAPLAPEAPPPAAPLAGPRIGEIWSEGTPTGVHIREGTPAWDEAANAKHLRVKVGGQFIDGK